MNTKTKKRVHPNHRRATLRHKGRPDQEREIRLAPVMAALTREAVELYGQRQPGDPRARLTRWQRTIDNPAFTVTVQIQLKYP